MVIAVHWPPPRYVLALAVGLAAFLAVGIWSAVTPTTYHAETAIVVGVGNGPLRPGAPGATLRLARSLDDLVESNLIAANVVSNLRLRESPRALLERISVSTPQPGLLRVRVDDRGRVRAEQIAQEIGLVFTNLVKLRFGGGDPPLRATVWDPAHAAGASGPAWGRNFGIAAGIAAAAAAAAFLSRRRLAIPAPPRPVPAPPPPLPPPAPAPVPKPVPESEPEPAIPDTARDLVPAVADGAWTLQRLERLVDRHAPDFPPERVEEWRFYLLYLRDYAGIDGRLPGSFEGLVLETFSDLIARE